MTKMKMLTMCLSLVACLLATGCGLWESAGQHIQQTQPAAVPVKPSNDCSVPKTQGEAQQLNPIRMVVFQDKTGSSATTRTSQLSEDDFTAPIGLLRCTGGELAVGIVDDVSNTSLARLRIEPPPTLEEEHQASNVFERAQQDAASQQRLSDHNETLNKWRAETDKRVGTFLAQISKVLQQKPNAKKTNVWSAISRADLFLSESDATWRRPTHRYAVFNTDGVDTARSKPTTIKSGAQLIIINGNGSTGIFQSLNPERFESVQAAFQFISAKETGGK